MKTQILKSVIGLVVVLALSIPTYAQLTYLRNVEVDNFKEIRVSLDTDVIILKSDRNQVTLVGDSSYVFGMPIDQKGEALTFSYTAEPEAKLKQVVIEYKDIDRVVTGGIGNYYFHNVDTKKLDIINPMAHVYLKGNSDEFRVISENGTTDISSLRLNKGIVKIGESARLLGTEAYVFSSRSLR